MLFNIIKPNYYNKKLLAQNTTIILVYIQNIMIASKASATVEICYKLYKTTCMEQS